jgi:transposase
VSTLDHTLKPELVEVRRLEVISGTGRRRHFSDEAKARIVEESLVPGAVVSEIARRHGLSPQQLFTWRRQVREAAAAIASADQDKPQFVPLVVEAASSERPVGRRERGRRADLGSGLIEVAIEGVTVRVARGADARTIAAVLRALKANA